MLRRKTSRLIAFFWVGLFALMVNSAAQNQLAVSVVSANLASGHVMPDGTFMLNAAMTHTDECAPGDEGGHTHKGHADCIICGVVAAIGAFSCAQPADFRYFADTAGDYYRSPRHDFVIRVSHCPYAARAPPSLHA